MTTVDDWTLAEVKRRTDRVPGLVAVLLVGSMARGESQAHSDIDINVFLLDAAPWALPVRDGGREVFFNREGRQIELAYMSLDYLRRRMREEASAGRRARLDWAEDGILLQGGGEAFHRLRTEALDLLKKGPPELVGKDRAWEIYDAWNRLKDVMDSAHDEELCAFLAPAAFSQLLKLFFRLSRTWEPRPRAALPAIQQASPEFFEVVRSFLGSHTAATGVEHLQLMARWLSDQFDFQYDVPYQSRPADCIDSV